MKVCSVCDKEKDNSEFYKCVISKDGLRNQCKSCVATRKKVYYQENKERIVVCCKEYYQENKERLMIQKKEHYQNNKERAVARRKNNKGKIIAYQKKYRQNNKERLAARQKQYRQTPEGKAKENRHNHKRRAQKLGAGYEKFDSLEIFERDNWRCQHCGKKVRPDYKNPNHPLYPNLDHIVCLSNGGSHTRKNTQLLCHKCNSIKHNNDSGEQLRLF